MKFWLAVLLILFTCTSSATEYGGWLWIRAGTIAGKGWDVSQGSAEVSIHGTKFSAKLFWQDPANKLRIVVEGIVKNGRISATENVQESDYTGSIYHGTLVRKKWGELFAGTMGAESITLSDGWNMIGINRDLH